MKATGCAFSDSGQAPVILDHMRAERHRRQFGVGLAVALRAELRRTAADRPGRRRGRGRAPPIAPRAGRGRASGTRRRRRGSPSPASDKAAAQPEIAHRIVASPRALDELAHVLLARADDLAKAQPHGVRRRGCARPSRRGGGGGASLLPLREKVAPKAPDEGRRVSASSPCPYARPLTHPLPQAGEGSICLQRAIPVRKVDVDLPHLDAMLARVAHELRRARRSRAAGN